MLTSRRPVDALHREIGRTKVTVARRKSLCCVPPTREDESADTWDEAVVEYEYAVVDGNTTP
ncbi:hypothetical protein GLAREA_00521 [Glarea lozoyensis ATCC 20868]|uniref:Uncharacterized protein n=1 Tax=Glarea lozoyensis (strain ATCC 20868 / MF5171) TaxID=1116229 RepID=S3DBM6_GLAL2|nr:uncharacterized protein GLAREA_00521 [Glarea lozoyensis ATCC 20868]EPE29361.1 hypothetical protein GLAREA_00521 [Glarea lozoyensis ATCC 20868]